MNDITILHLSDLHINSIYSNCSYSLNKMLSDIEVQTRKLKNIVIVVTGDIVHRGNYECRTAVLDFFSKLDNILGTKVKNIYIVPGNHDKNRLPLDRRLLESIQRNSDVGIEYYRSSWEYHKIPFSDFSELQREVYNIFGCADSDFREISIGETFGAELFDIDGKKYAFILFNSAWACIGDCDKRNLRIGRFQIETILDSLKRQWNGLANEPDGIDLTFVLAHHPLSWLIDTEEDYVRVNLLSKDSLNADVFICGHTHNRDIVNWHNNRHTLTTLTTGFGWPDDENREAPQSHTYSIYVFHLELNSIDIFVRSNDDSMNFDTDFRMYTNKRDRDLSKIVFPIQAYKNHPYIQLHTADKSNEKVCYLTDSLVHSIKESTVLLASFNRKSEAILNRCKYNLTVGIQSAIKDSKDDEIKTDMTRLLSLLWSDEDDRGIRHEYSLLFAKYENLWTRITSESLSLLVKQICLQLARVMDEIAERRNERVRIHFRYYYADTDSYLRLFACNTKGEEQPLSDISWGGLIKECYNNNETLINSINENISHVSMKSHWKNFITIIPYFAQNSILINIDGYDEWRPLLTFGISIGNHALDDILYVFDFFDINKTIGALFEEFLCIFPVDLASYLETGIAE